VNAPQLNLNAINCRTCGRKLCSSMKKKVKAPKYKRITNNQLIGSRGESFVSFLLSKYCLVRPVANGTDIGVDLYCESLIEGVPHCHFWVQVKSVASGTTNKMKFRVRDLEYWSRQPIPVFIFLIPIEENLTLNNFHIQVFNMTEKFIQNPELNSSSNYKTLKSDFVISSPEHLKEFVNYSAPSATARLWLRDGIILPIKKEVQQTYVLSYESRGIRKFSKAIMKKIGRMSALLLRDIVISDDISDFKKERSQLEKILETFNAWGNYDFHYSLGLSKKIDGCYAEAIEAFQRALQNINADKKVDARQTSLTKGMIETYIRQMEKKL
jgi:hypothetical protein